MAITTTNPLTVPATVERTYDLWWLTNLTINAGDPNGIATATANFRRFTRDEYGVGHFAPTTGMGDDDASANYHIENVFALAASDPNVAALIDNLINTVGELARTAGKIT